MSVKTIGRHIPKRDKRRGVFVAQCDQCDARYYGRQLREMEDGTVLCFGPGTLNDAKGRVGVTLDRLNAEHAKRAITLPLSERRTGRFSGAL